jgi:hypothetical protein
MGGKILRYMKKDWNGLRCNWQKNRMTKVHTKHAVMRMNYKTNRGIAFMMTAMKKNFLKKTKTNYTIMQSLKGTEI